MRSSLLGGLIAAAMLLAGANAMAAFNIGARAGYSSNPDQFVIGGQAVIGSVAPFIQLAPSLDLGFGNNVSTTALNIDLQFNLPSLPKISPNIYVGAGPTLVMANPDKGNSDTEVGISLVAGLRIPMAGISYYNLETRFGLNNVPDLKVLLGIMFGL
jgi:hypothetical protein